MYKMASYDPHDPPVLPGGRRPPRTPRAGPPGAASGDAAGSRELTVRALMQKPVRSGQGP